jgi:hypothetical protein
MYLSPIMSSLSARPLARSPGDAPWDARTLCWRETLWTHPYMETKRNKKGGMSHKKDKLVVERSCSGSSTPCNLHVFR